MYEEANDEIVDFFCRFLCVFGCFILRLPTLCGANFCDALRKRCRKVTALDFVRGLEFLVRKKIA